MNNVTKSCIMLNYSEKKAGGYQEVLPIDTIFHYVIVIMLQIYCLQAEPTNEKECVYSFAETG